MLRCPSDHEDKSRFACRLLLSRQRPKLVACTAVSIPKEFHLLPQDCANVFFVRTSTKIHLAEVPMDITFSKHSEQHIYESIVLATQSTLKRLIALIDGEHSPHHQWLSEQVRRCEQVQLSSFEDFLKVEYNTATGKCFMRGGPELKEVIIPQRECAFNCAETRPNSLLALFGLRFDGSGMAHSVSIPKDRWISPLTVHLHGLYRWILIKCSLVTASNLSGEQIPELLCMVCSNHLGRGLQPIPQALFVSVNNTCNMDKINVELTDLNGRHISFAPNAQPPVLLLDFKW